MTLARPLDWSDPSVAGADMADAYCSDVPVMASRKNSAMMPSGTMTTITRRPPTSANCSPTWSVSMSAARYGSEVDY
jgi:hypothetical protein